jgi:hypothetical protein
VARLGTELKLQRDEARAEVERLNADLDKLALENVALAAKARLIADIPRTESAARESDLAKLRAEVEQMRVGLIAIRDVSAGDRRTNVLASMIHDYARNALAESAGGSAFHDERGRPMGTHCPRCEGKGCIGEPCADCGKTASCSPEPRSGPASTHVDSKAEKRTPLDDSELRKTASPETMRGCTCFHAPELHDSTGRCLGGRMGEGCGCVCAGEPIPSQPECLCDDPNLLCPRHAVVTCTPKGTTVRWGGGG